MVVVEAEASGEKHRDKVGTVLRAGELGWRVERPTKKVANDYCFLGSNHPSEES